MKRRRRLYLGKSIENKKSMRHSFMPSYILFLYFYGEWSVSSLSKLAKIGEFSL
jgi:hypothetical protein